MDGSQTLRQVQEAGSIEGSFGQENHSSNFASFLNSKREPVELQRRLWVDKVTEKCGTHFRPAIETLCDWLQQGLYHKGSKDGCILVTGASGVGKSYLLDVFAEQANLKTIFVDSKNALDIVRSLPESKEPVLVIADHIDILASIAAADIANRNRNVFLVGITSALRSIDPLLLSSKRFYEWIELKPPNGAKEREQVIRISYSSLLSQSNGARSGKSFFVSESTIKFLAARTHGMVPAELSAIARESIIHHVETCETASEISVRSVKVALSRISPAILKQEGAFVLASQTTSTSDEQLELQAINPMQGHDANIRKLFANLCGMHHPKRELYSSILLPLLNLARLEELGIQPPKGVLLYGSSGNGKTYIANYLSKSIENLGLANFVSVRCPEIVSKTVGETEDSIGRIFAKARDASPCILFLDQLEALAPKRGNDTSSQQSFDRLLSCLLIEMDGIANKKRGDVIILATTSLKSSVDPAILRPGRLDYHIKCDVPDTLEREEILMKLLHMTPIDLTSSDTKESFCAVLAKRSEGLSIADICGLVKESIMKALRNDLSSLKVSEHFFLSTFPEICHPSFTFGVFEGSKDTF